MTRRWFWIGAGIACITFLESVFSGSDVSDGVKWLVYGLIGLGALAKAFESQAKSKAERYVNEGYRLQDSGDCSAAEACFQKAMSLLSELKDATDRQVGMALQHSNLGLLYHQWGRTDEAEQSLRKSIQIYRGLGRLDESAPIHGSLAKLYFDIDKLDLAAKAATDALHLYRQRGGSQEAIGVLENLLLQVKRKE